MTALATFEAVRLGEDRYVRQTSAQWHVLHVKSRQEKALATDLDRLGVSYYLPLREKVALYGGRRFKLSLPLFPGYMFLLGGRDEAIHADRTRRLVRIIDVSDQDRLARELHNIRVALDQGADLAPHHLPQRGWRVSVRMGPFEGLQGIVEDRTAANRLILQVNLLGQAVSMEMDGDLLEVLSQI